jgi:hypothetical protein
MNGDSKPDNGSPRHDAHAGDLAEQLSRLAAVDRRITPRHVARRFRELQHALSEETRASAPSATLAAERPYAREAAGPGIEQPTPRARLVSVLEPAYASAAADIEQPTAYAMLTVSLKSLSGSEPLADIEQPSRLAEWGARLAPLPPLQP